MIRSNIVSALVFVEHPKVTAIVSALVRDADYRQFQNELMENPEKGDVIQGTGGFRKARMRLAGDGKSGGARVIYLYLPDREVIFIGALYKKSKQETLTDHEKQILKGAAHDIKTHYKLGRRGF
jgi:hypothetical protein